MPDTTPPEELAQRETDEQQQPREETSRLAQKLAETALL